MASVQELLLAAESKQSSPLTSLLEGVATGFRQGQVNQGTPLSRAKAMVEMENDRQDRERAAETHRQLLAQIAGQAEQQVKNSFNGVGAADKTPPMPALKLHKAVMGKEGYLKPEFEVAAPKSLQSKEYQDRHGVNRLGQFDPATGRLTTSPQDELAPKTAAAGSNVNSTRLMKVFLDRPEVKDYQEISTQVQKMDALAAEARKTGNKVGIDQAIISVFNKVNDPGSVVRESEYARTPENLPMVNRIVGAVSKWKQGGAGMTSDDRDALVLAAKIIANTVGQKFNEQKRQYNELATLQGLDDRLITGTIKEFTPYRMSQPLQVGKIKVHRGGN